MICGCNDGEQAYEKAVLYFIEQFLYIGLHRILFLFLQVPDGIYDQANSHHAQPYPSDISSQFEIAQHDGAYQ